MIRTALIATLIAVAATGVAQSETMSTLRWDKRVVIIFAVAGDPRIAQQTKELLRDEAALADRDLLVFAVVGDRVEPIYGKAPTEETAAGLRQRYAVAAETPFTAVLIGKDGGVKWRGGQPIGAADLAGTIDAMSMRRTGD